MVIKATEQNNACNTCLATKKNRSEKARRKKNTIKKKPLYGQKKKLSCFFDCPHMTHFLYIAIHLLPATLIESE